MTYKIKYPQKISSSELELYFLDLGFEELVEASKEKPRTINQMNMENPYPPELEDLYRLHQYILLNNRTTILEFGCGWSSLVMADSLSSNKDKLGDSILRRGNPFELHILDNEKEYLEIAVSRIKSDNVYTHFSELETYEYQGKLTTRYQTLPFINPDFIYLDGPDQFNVNGTIRGLSTAHVDFMPMSSDILLFEHFMLPGSIIVVDGRTANARFLRANLQRSWDYQHLVDFDQHIFLLAEDSLGKVNSGILDFYEL